uniref:SNARE associated Golgi protein family n=1 Tax=Brassica oleracea var. oleracea TaxID=109376 RepID=A0A0D3DEP7_BRAOL
MERGGGRGGGGGETTICDVNPPTPTKSVTPRYSLSFWEVTAASGVVLGFLIGLVCVYLTMPQSDYSFLKLPRNLHDLQILRDNLEIYTSDYTVQVLVGYSLVYVFMQTFMIPGTVFMSLLAGALFGVFKGMALVVSTATAGASSCFLLSKLIGRPLIFSLWPDKLVFFQDQKRKEFPFLQALWPPLSLLKSALSLLFLGLRSSLHLLGIGPVLGRAWLMAIHSMIYNTPPWMP